MSSMGGNIGSAMGGMFGGGGGQQQPEPAQFKLGNVSSGNQSDRGAILQRALERINAGENPQAVLAEIQIKDPEAAQMIKNILNGG